MNKQEAIEIVESRAFNIGDIDLACGLSYTKHIINQIDEPRKVVVPKHIADKIEYYKDIEEYGLLHAMDDCYQRKDSAEWLEDNQETFARAWLDGFEVEKEKLYTVEIPSPNRTTEPTIYLSRDERGKIFLTSWFLPVGQNWKKHPHSHLTESEIKEDFEWAWQWAKEAENE